MKSIFFAAALLLGSIARAQVITYDERNCEVLDEERVSLEGSDVCKLKIRCERYPSNNPEKVVVSRLVGFCRPLESGRCPTKPENCLDDESLKAADIPKIKPLPDRPSQKPCGEDSVAPQGKATIVPLDANGNPMKSTGGRQ